eukprot:CAMPEP_0182428024 /NCGR_PEP_ID=MMETSP1167-20130531/20958_1 /TAXON_ID=2988 /ORGANISM="Mallomonas Sp, Strain CCMP3275" /LENGTH=300 /DNA_ID=CAMNT_0024610649 /DNA_START=177 /DNA_END=1079 /DNA_ORIENTATION=+
MSGPKGEAFMAEAEKALKRTIIFGFGRNQKYEDAAEAFTKAGNAFKILKQWKEAGDAFLKAADCQKQTDSPNDSVNSYVEAGNSYKFISPMEAIESYDKAVAIYNENGRFSQSARYYKEIAELYEKENNIELAIANYQQSADIQHSENKKQGAQQCLLKIATLASESEKEEGGGGGGIARAGEIFEMMGRECMESRLGAYSAKGYFFQAALCYLALGDAVATREKIQLYKTLDYTFNTSRECQFIEKLLESIDAYNSEDFAQACADFDHITPLDPWKTSMLLKAKRHLKSQAGEDEVDLT